MAVSSLLIVPQNHSRNFSVNLAVVLNRPLSLNTSLATCAYHSASDSTSYNRTSPYTLYKLAMGMYGVVTRVQPVPFCERPIEIQVLILKHLPPADIINVLKNFPSIRGSAVSWDFAQFSAEQLVHMYHWSTHDHRLTLETPGLSIRIMHQLKRKMNKFAKNVQLPVPLEPFNAYYHQIRELCREGEPDDEEVEFFVQNFHRRNKKVEDFCQKISELDPKRRYQRWPKYKPDGDTWMSHLLFWFAMEYIRSKSGNVNEATITTRWEEFHVHLLKTFGRQASVLLRNAIMPQGVLLLKYRDYIVECNPVHLSKIYETLGRRACHVKLETFVAFALSNGFDQAMKFLNEKQEILEFFSFLGAESRQTLYAWQNIWENFNSELPEEVEGEQY
ncbi:hypothetical protein H072_6108 [Dactylellina haptotyla CBS 200.50]|uniref:Uncharacterized protein n=1 Tax=Dactylellina haptotyla (strain CBS 200.50) TaxID=1284197 RepID=S8BXN7_DACHA|nr:hypothetical protein H072_6108 [Dactylellina haptotyla CBS 200.50]